MSIELGMMAIRVYYIIITNSSSVSLEGWMQKKKLVNVRVRMDCITA